MSQYILLRNIEVENANAIHGITYGFPSPISFLGFTHAVSRHLQQRFDSKTTLGGVGIICHEHQVHTQRIGYDTIFSLSRNPITKDGKTAPFNEEGRMHFTVSLLIKCNFDVLDLELGEGAPEQREKQFCNVLRQQAEKQRLAGGTITRIGMIKVLNFDPSTDECEREFKRWMLRLIPGFVLKDRHDALAQHHQQRLTKDAESHLLDSWLDFIALDSEAVLPDGSEGDAVEGETAATWEIKPKPEMGYFIPLSIGFESISELYEPNKVLNARDNSIPFHFVESAYSVGQWVGPHRIKTPEELLWNYHYEENEHGKAFYICRSQSALTINTPASENEVASLFDNDF